MKFLALFSISIFGFSCSKSLKSSPETPLQQAIDFTTKYSSSVAVTFAKPLNADGLHAESLKVLKIDNGYILITANAMLMGLTYDYFRAFRIDTVTGQLSENTTTLLGGYYEVGFPKSPFFYEDLNGDGIRDLFEVDHGKETPSLMVNGQFPGFVNHLFWGTAQGTFSYAPVPDLTDTKRFHHNASLGDMDGDGDNDLILQYFGSEEMIYFKAQNGLKKDRVINPNNATGAVLINDIDGDGTMDILSAPYIDKGSTPNTYLLKINLTQSGYTSSKISGATPFGQSYGCFKILALKNPKQPTRKNILYFVESGVGDQKIFRGNENDIAKLDDISTLQSTFKSNGIRDFLITDLNFDGLEDLFFIVNTGENLNQRVWLNKGDNTFENPSWDIDLSLKDFFIPLTIHSGSGRIKFIYYANSINPTTRIIDVYTKKR